MRSNLLLSVALWAAAAQTKPGSFEAVVTNALTGEPIVRVHVMLDAGGKRYGAVSTADGKVAIAGLEPRQYVIRAVRAGFLPWMATIEMRPDSGLREFSIKLTPEGSISGRVVSPDGTPQEGVRVDAVFGQRWMTRPTNDRGEFRIDDAPPGQYRLKAAPPRPLLPPEIRTDGTEEKHYGDTWYPGSLDDREAQTIVLRAGQEIDGLEIRLLPAPRVRVSGVATGGSSAGSVEAEKPSDPTFSRLAVVNGSAFAVWDLSPGKYLLAARAGTMSSAPVEFEIAGTNVEGIELTMLLPFAVTGRVEWESPPAGEQKMSVEMRSASSRRGLIRSQVAADGSFCEPNVRPDRYSVSVSGGPEGTYAKAVYLGSREMRDGVLDLSRGAPEPVTVRLSADGASVSGVVRDGHGPVGSVAVELSAGGQAWRVGTNAQGVYRFANLAPGKYRFVLAGNENAEEIEVRERDRLVKDLKVPE